MLLHLVHQLRGRIHILKIGRERCRPDPQRSAFSGARFRIFGGMAKVNRYITPSSRQPHGDGAAHAPRGAGYQGGFRWQLHTAIIDARRVTVRAFSPEGAEAPPGTELTLPPATEPILIRPANPEDVPAITDIYNEAILTTTATFDTEPKTTAERSAWLAGHDDRHPVMVAELDGQVVGWAAITRWSDRCAYDATGETSFYVHSTHRGRGAGTQLLAALLTAARAAGFHTLLARIAEGSDASLRLHLRAGFVLVGTMQQVGRKFGRLLDVHVLQKLLAASD